MHTRTRILTLTLTVGVASILPGGSPAAAAQIFADGFESGDTSAWFRTREQRPGLLQVTPDAAMNGTGLGLEVTAGGRAWVESRDADRETDLDVSFFFSADNWEMLVKARIEIMRMNAQGRRDHVRLALLPAGDDVRVVLLARGNRGGFEVSGGGLLSSGQDHLLQVQWRAASTPDGSDGSASLWIDGQPVAESTTLANGRLDVRSIQLGVVGGTTTRTAGSLYFDEVSLSSPTP